MISKSLLDTPWKWSSLKSRVRIVKHMSPTTTTWRQALPSNLFGEWSFVVGDKLKIQWPVLYYGVGKGIEVLLPSFLQLSYLATVASCQSVRQDKRQWAFVDGMVILYLGLEQNPRASDPWILLWTGCLGLFASEEGMRAEFRRSWDARNFRVQQNVTGSASG